MATPSFSLLFLALFLIPCLCSIMATYNLYGLTDNTTDIISSEGWVGQPTLQWPSDTSKKPDIKNDGLEFQNEKYLEFSTNFDNAGADYISVNIWFYRAYLNVPGKIINIGNNFSNSGYAQGVGQLYLNAEVELTSYLYNYVYINDQKVPGVKQLLASNEWVSLGFGWGKDEGYFKFTTSSSSKTENGSLPISTWTVNDKMYIGCYNNTCRNAEKFKVHSIRISSDKLPASGADLYNAPYNEWYSSCSSGTIETGEACDDGNYNNGDGCDQECAVEAGWVCTGGSSATPSVCGDFCGDGFNMQSSTTYCDDGNNSNGDGCSATCQVEDLFSCSGGTPTSQDSCTASCRSNTAPSDPSTTCYDGNDISGDGCDQTCNVESDYTCSWNSSTSTSECTDICGDGKVITSMPSDYCDDGNTNDNDGCSSTCAVEPNWTCSPGDPTTASSCSDICSDGKVMSPTIGYCDDGDSVDGDGCSSTCATETGYVCTLGDSTTASVCSDDCGDGIVMIPASGYCDDGNGASGDGCSTTCAVETGWDCTLGDSSTASTCIDSCGDGKVMGPTVGYCDDGNTNNNDGCSSTCQVEPNWSCTLGDTSTASSCTEVCGDGVVINPTAGYCDDGDTVNNDGCSFLCEVESGYTCTLGDATTASSCSEDCGDGKVMNPTAGYCDDGDNIDNDGCSSACAVEPDWTCTLGDSSTESICTDVCGDGVVVNPDVGYCDDGGVTDGDGCSSSCSVEPHWSCTLGSSLIASDCTEVCGDGAVVNQVQGYCDDNNTRNGDGCNSNCEVEVGWTCTLGDLISPSECSEPSKPTQLCKLKDCKICDPIKENNCSECDSGYQLLNDGTCRFVEVTDAVQTMSSSTQAAAGVGMIAAAISSVLNASSPATIWSMANQLQLILLLLLTQSSLPSDVRGYIIGNSMFSFNMEFDFLPLKNNFISKIPLDWMKKNQTNLGLEDMGQESGSSFNNNFSLMSTLVLAMIFHGIIMALPHKLDRKPENGKEKVVKVLEKVWNIFTFGVYLRFILEAFQNITLSSINELKNYNFTNLNLQISSGFSLLFITIMFFILSLCISQIFQTPSPDSSSSPSTLSELTTGLRPSKSAKTYTTLLILRRLLFSIWLIIFSYLGCKRIIPGMLLFQILYTLYILIIRPFEQKVPNLIESINEIFFCVLVGYLVRYNSEEDWSGVSKGVFIGIMVANNFIVVGVVFVASLGGIVKKCYVKGETQGVQVECINVRDQIRYRPNEVSVSDLPFRRSELSTSVGRGQMPKSRNDLIIQAKRAIQKLSSRNTKVIPIC